MSLIAVENPATGEVLGEIADFGEMGVDEAVAAAQPARWLDLDPAKRQQILWQIAARIDQDSDDLTLLATLESGQHVLEAASLFRLAANQLPTYATQSTTGHLTIEHSPVGVTAAILHWHQPLRNAALHIASALATGNSIIIKPSALTPYTALRLMQLAEESGVPEGVIQVATGHGKTTGDAIARHAGIHQLHFHGSTNTARRIWIAAAESNLKAITITHPQPPTHIIRASADLRAASAHPQPGNYFIERSVENEFLDLLLPRIHEQSNWGSLAGPAHLERTLDHLKTAKTQGATLISGGDAQSPPGYNITPAILTNVSPTAQILREHSLAPIFNILTFASFDSTLPLTEEIHLWTGNPTEATALPAASLSLNTHQPPTPSDLYAAQRTRLRTLQTVR